MDSCFKTNLEPDYFEIPAGTAHYLEHKMFELPGRDVSAEFAALGASLAGCPECCGKVNYGPFFMALALPVWMKPSSVLFPTGDPAYGTYFWTAAVC